MGKNISKNSRRMKSTCTELNVLQVSVISGDVTPLLKSLSPQISQHDTINHSFYRLALKHGKGRVQVLHLPHGMVINRSSAVLKNIYRDAKAISILIDMDEEDNLQTAIGLIRVILTETQLEGLSLFISVKKDFEEGNAVSEIEKMERELSMNDIQDRSWHVTIGRGFNHERFNESLVWLANHDRFIE